MIGRSQLQQQLQILSSDRVLFYGIGNEGRQDDGVGIRLISALEQFCLPSGWDLDANYQLNAEVALQISEYDVVIFLDASRKQVEAPFYIEKISPDNRIAFSTHAMSAASILGLCEKLYVSSPRCFWIGIPGFSWEFGEMMSEEAERNTKCLLNEISILINDFDVQARGLTRRTHA